MASSITRDDIARAFHRFPLARITTLDSRAAARLEALLRRRVTTTESGRACAIRTLLASVETSKPGALVLLKGGVPRDILVGREPRDVDAVYTKTDRATILAHWRTLFGRDLKISVSAPPLGLVGLGKDSDDAFEVSAIHLHECAIDAPANALMIHCATRTLIDPFGYGEKDARENVWRIPCPDRDEWADIVRIPMWRMIKFRLRGFTVPAEDQAAVYKHFMDSTATDPHAAWVKSSRCALAPDPAAALDLIINDLIALRHANLTHIEPHDLLLRIVRIGVLVTPDPTARAKRGAGHDQNAGRGPQKRRQRGINHAKP